MSSFTGLCHKSMGSYASPKMLLSKKSSYGIALENTSSQKKSYEQEEMRGGENGVLPLRVSHFDHRIYG